MSYDIDYVTTPDEREQKLPGWARTIIGRLRSEAQSLQVDLGKAEETIKTLRGETAPDAKVFAVLHDGSEIGLPGDSEVQFRLPGGVLSVGVEDDKVNLDAGQRSLTLTPTAAFLVKVDVV